MGYACDGHPDRTAAVLITNLGNGDVAAVCGQDCLGQWAAALAESFGYTVTAPEASAPTEDDTDDESADTATGPAPVTDPELAPVTVPEAVPDLDPDTDPAREAGTSSPDVDEDETAPGTVRESVAIPA